MLLSNFLGSLHNPPRPIHDSVQWPGGSHGAEYLTECIRNAGMTGFAACVYQGAVNGLNFPFTMYPEKTLK